MSRLDYTRQPATDQEWVQRGVRPEVSDGVQRQPPVVGLDDEAVTQTTIKIYSLKVSGNIFPTAENF